MRRAVILHGTDGSPEHHWIPWLKLLLEQAGYEVFAPLLPNNHTPNTKDYLDFLFSQDWDYADNVIIGHSSGATTVFTMLQDDRCPAIAAAVPVASFLELTNEVLESEWYDPGQFDHLFPESGFDWELIKSKCSNFYFVHGDNDPFCPVNLAQDVMHQVDGDMVVVKNGGHLGGSSGLVELPALELLLEAHELI